MQSFKYVVAILFSALLFAGLGFVAFLDSMAGSQKVQNSWRLKNYKIEYIADQGFAGGALMKYELSKYWVIPILVKKVDYSVVGDTSNNCLIHFNKAKIDFNKCNLALRPVTR
jgi:hypothetical protein